MKDNDILQLQEKLLDWFEIEKRDLPWRKTCDPYKIWISEVMLQQTQVKTVIKYYKRFIKALPDVQALADAEEELVYKLWEGLGYYSRAKRLKQCALILTQQHNSTFPQNYKKALALPGIGSYTAGAVLSIAYNMPLPAVDGNVMRVLSRIFNMDSDIGKQKTKKEFEMLAKTLLPREVGQFNQALMELGSVVCTPKRPQCEQCPLSFLCQSYQVGNQLDRPVKARRLVKKKLEMEAAYVVNDNKVLIIKRPTEGLLANLWGLPIIEKQLGFKDGKSIIQELQDSFDLQTDHIEVKKRAVHIFTHRIWNIICYRIEVSKSHLIDYPYHQWITHDQLNTVPFPTVFKKLI